MDEIEQLKLNLQDRKWRLNNLYYIKDENGNKILFKLNAVQELIHDNLWYMTIIPKARQLGCTTFFCILYLDQVLFSQNKTAGIIFHKQEDMKRKFRNVIKFAWDNLYPWLKAEIGEPDTNNANELVFPNGGSIFVSMSTRGGTVQYLHISEFAYVCAKAPEKAEEIVTGAINSVHRGNMISMESTAAGRSGYFYKFCTEAEKLQKEGRTLSQMDWKLFFFPWFLDDKYTEEETDFPFTREYLTYFDSLRAKYGITLTDGQKRWYIKKKNLMGDKMYSEFPSTMDEAFSVSLEGSYYSKEMIRVYEQRRIQILPVLPDVKVDTYWDLGMSDDTVILFVQTVGATIRFVDCYVNRGEGLAHYAKILEEKKYRYGKHTFPHDVAVRDMSVGKTRKQTLYELGLTDIRVAPKLGIQDGIDKVRMLFPRFIFDEEKCKPITDSLSNYRKDFDEKLGVFKDSARHDEASHVADAVRVLAITWNEEMNLGLEDIEDKNANQSFFV